MKNKLQKNRYSTTFGVDPIFGWAGVPSQVA